MIIDSNFTKDKGPQSLKSALAAPLPNSQRQLCPHVFIKKRSGGNDGQDERKRVHSKGGEPRFRLFDDHNATGNFASLNAESTSPRVMPPTG